MPRGRGPFFVIPARSSGGWRETWRMGQRPAQPAPGSYTRPVRAELDRSAATVLNAQGSGSVTLMPDGFDVWQVKQLHVQTSTGPTDAAAVFLYRNAVVQHRAVGETSQGGGDTLNFDILLRAGDTLIAIWAGGNSGDVATLTISGTVHTKVPG